MTDQRKIFLKASDVIELLGISKSTLYRLLEVDSTFPKQIRIGQSTGTARWVASEIETWMEQRIKASRQEAV
jgi:prophage regulatory protein